MKTSHNPQRNASASYPALRRLAAVIDLGSNSVRLVIYDCSSTHPQPYFNEKVVAGLAQGIEKTGELSPEGVELASAALFRFARLCRQLDVERVMILATAAVREARNGPAFVDRIESNCGVKVEIVSGEREASLSAKGILASNPGADGLVADIGGGSLDVIELDNGKPGRFATLPLGTIRLPEHVGFDRKKAKSWAEELIGGVDWLGDLKGRNFYPIGGAWRALGRTAMDHASYPLEIIDNYVIDRQRATDIAQLVGSQSAASLKSLPSIPKRRAETVPFAAIVMERLLKVIRPDRVVFSASSMREGCVYEYLGLLDGAERDPLLDSCRDLAAKAGRDVSGKTALSAWMAPLLSEVGPATPRLRTAAAFLSNVGWMEHPEYRAETSYIKILQTPFIGLRHFDRAFLALAIHTRYEGGNGGAEIARKLLDDEAQSAAKVVGLALRLAHGIGAGQPAMAVRTRLSMDKENVTLHMPRGDDLFSETAFSSRLKKLANALDRNPAFEWMD
jgi:exopolyphosphatase/guanosine-5'-triphosphate,3'-diphosphate pyrophosphatase